MFEQLGGAEERYQAINDQLMDPNVVSDPKQYAQLMKEYKNLTPIVEKYREYKKAQEDMDEAKMMLEESGLEKDFRELIEEQYETSKKQIETIAEELKILLIPKDPNDDKNVIVEIRGGAGGDEAALFANSLFRMYSMYAESKGWKIEVLNSNPTELGGYKEVSFSINGDGAYSKFKFESGVHRVQRVPETETQGRIHTSTVTVAVLPEADEVEIHIDPKDLKPRKQRQYSRKERWANWWDYNLKWVLIFGIAGAFVAYCFIGQYFLTTHPDYNVAVVSPYYLPEATVTALQEQLAAYGEDCNGDGKVVVKLNQYTMAFNSEDSDAYLDMAGTTKLSTDIQSSLSSIFILYDPAGFQQTTGTLRYLDGHLPKSDADSDWWNMVYRWTDCPVLTGMELGSYTSDAVQSASGDSQQLLADYYIGIRGAWLKESASLLENSEPLWANLTAGAVSTAGEGH